MNKSRIIIALDYADPKKALALVGALEPQFCRLKVGKELFCRSGPAFVEGLAKRGFDVFLDLKFHDIPSTVAQACLAATDLGVWMVNMHALGGQTMMESARNAIQAQPNPPLLIAVTLLTSLDEADIGEVGLQGTPEDNVIRLASLAKRSGMDGVVCSPKEIAVLRQGQGAGFALVTPGIRPQGSVPDDQKRTLTPQDAIRSGADYLVVGRPITAVADPLRALLALQLEINTVASS